MVGRKVAVSVCLVACCATRCVSFVIREERHRCDVRVWDSAARVKAAGGGSPVFAPYGKRALFDPDVEGKLQGTGSVNERIAAGFEFRLAPPARAAVSEGRVESAQAWLEQLDEDGGVPLNFAKPTAPAIGTVLGRTRIISPDAPGDIQHVLIRLPTGMHCVEGQSLSVIAPGHDAVTGRPHKPRLYSIASTRYGDLLDGSTASLCVRRADYFDPVTSTIDPLKKGICSHFLCDAAPNTSVAVAGPVGKTMLLPKDPNVDIIMIATGTGIAPFRAFMHRLFVENTLANHLFAATAWLLLGVPVTGGILYKEEFDAMLANANQGQLKIDYAISREMTNTVDGGRFYVQHLIADHAQEFFQRLNDGAHVYFCGLKGMMPPILDTLERVATERGLDWNQTLKHLKSNNQWHVEVY